MRAYLILFYTFYCVLAREIPSYVNLCGRHDPEISKCMVKTIYELIPYLEKKGIPEMDLAPIDPIYIPEVRTNTGNSSSTADLEVKLSNITVFELSKVDIKSYTADVDSARFSAVLYHPLLRLEGNYEIKGKVLMLAVDSKGVTRNNCTGLTTNVEWYGKFYTKENEEYIQFEKIDVKVKIEKIQVHFDNAVKDNAALSEAINKAINEHIEMIVSDIAPIAEDVVGKLATVYFNRPFSLFPVKQLFPE